MRTMIWPAYIDSKKTKTRGRRIPKKYAIPSPKLREIYKAAEKLHLNPEIEAGKSYPRSWWESSGRISLDKDMPKRELLKKISNMIKGSTS